MMPMVLYVVLVSLSFRYDRFCSKKRNPRSPRSRSPDRKPDFGVVPKLKTGLKMFLRDSTVLRLSTEVLADLFHSHVEACSFLPELEKVFTVLRTCVVCHLPVRDRRLIQFSWETPTARFIFPSHLRHSIERLAHMLQAGSDPTPMRR